MFENVAGPSFGPILSKHGYPRCPPSIGSIWGTLCGLSPGSGPLLALHHGRHPLPPEGSRRSNGPSRRGRPSPTPGPGPVSGRGGRGRGAGLRRAAPGGRGLSTHWSSAGSSPGQEQGKGAGWPPLPCWCTRLGSNGTASPCRLASPRHLGAARAMHSLVRPQDRNKARGAGWPPLPCWCTRLGSNQRPLASEANALSN